MKINERFERRIQLEFKHSKYHEQPQNEKENSDLKKKIGREREREGEEEKKEEKRKKISGKFKQEWQICISERTVHDKLPWLDIQLSYNRRDTDNIIWSRYMKLSI